MNRSCNNQLLTSSLGLFKLTHCQFVIPLLILTFYEWMVLKEEYFVSLYWFIENSMSR